MTPLDEAEILLVEDNPDVSDAIMTTLSLQGYAMRDRDE